MAHFSLDNLLKAGVCRADNVVVVKEGATAVEEHLADCTTIITVQKIHKSVLSVSAAVSGDSKK